MSGGFYALLGIEPTSSAARVRSAYGQALARLSKAQRARIEAGGSVDDLDLERARLDEAWDVLSDPLRRRRYDALLRWSAGDRPTDPEAVWAEVGEALVHPAASVAVRLLRVTSQLAELGELPRAPSGAAVDPATLIPHDDDLTTPRLPPEPPDPEAGASEVRTHRLRVVEGGGRRRGAPDVLAQPRSSPGADRVAAAAAPEVARLPADEIRFLIEEHGHSGRLLRAVRERQGLTLRAVSDQTRISEAYLAAVEDEDPGALPAATFVRGYVRDVARMLDLDADTVVQGYMQRFRRVP